MVNKSKDNNNNNSSNSLVFGRRPQTKIIGNVENQTRGSWVRSVDATSVKAQIKTYCRKVNRSWLQQHLLSFLQQKK